MKLQLKSLTSPKTNCEPSFTTRKLLRESVIVPQYRTQSIPLAFWSLMRNKVQVSFVQSRNPYYYFYFLNKEPIYLTQKRDYNSIMTRVRVIFLSLTTKSERAFCLLNGLWANPHYKEMQTLSLSHFYKLQCDQLL